MLGLFLIYYLGKFFYDLAGRHDKNQWGYAVLGVISYYGGAIVMGIIIAVIMEFVSPGWLDSMDTKLLDFFLLPFGLLSSWMFYKYLESRFANELIKSNDSSSDILDDGFFD